MKTISVIIPTYNGEKKVVKAVRSLENQTLMPNEVIIVVDGSTDNTVASLEKESFQLPKLKIIQQENQGRAQVRNRGATEASGELLVFLDDDMITPENWLRAHADHHDQYPNTLMTGYLEAPLDKPFNELSSYQKWLNSRWQEVSKDENIVFLLSNPYISANNFSIKKTDFYTLGCFDSRLSDLEDRDLAIRADSMNYQLYLNKYAMAYHNDTHSITFQKYIKRLREYEAAHQKLIKIKPEIYLNKSRNKQLHTKNPIKIAIFRFFSTRLWINLIENGYLAWLPLSIKYTIYDIIITANSKIFPEKVKID